MTRRRSVGLIALVAVAALLVALAGPAGAAPPGQKVALPTVELVTGGHGSPAIVSTAFDLASVGYVGEEYFLQGTATSYSAAAPFRPNGRWKVTPDATAPYTSRIVVYKPADARDFDGTVFVEWFNITSGIETGPAWTASHTELIRSGAAWVGVSAQAAGLQGSMLGTNLSPGGIKAGDPERYARINHPGDAFSYDIFSQAGLAAAGKTKLDPLAGLDVKRVIAVAKSQSAFRMVTYADAIQPVSHVYDGILVNSRAASSAGLGDSGGSYGLGDPGMPGKASIRTDLDVPVLLVQSETDLTVLDSVRSRQPDSKRVRTWEIAGAAHTDSYATGTGFGDTGDGAAEKTLLDPTKAAGGPLSCGQPINAGPGFPTLNAALFQLERWVRDGTPPPKGARIETTAGPSSTTTGQPTAVIVRDEHGNAKGGVRTPFVDVPIATLTGNRNVGGSFCSLFGTTTPFDAATIAALYPTHADYVKKFDASTDKAVKAGFLLAPEAKNLKAAAASLPIGG
jgi:Alpha/beta hydrolase domain